MFETREAIAQWYGGRGRSAAGPRMNRVERALRRIAADLDAAERVWCLVDALASSVRARPRPARDVHAAVAVADDEDAESVIEWMQGAGYRVVNVTEQTALGRLATVRLLPPGEHEHGAPVDLFFASSGIEAEIAATAERLLLLPMLTVPVARLGHLIALKVLAHELRHRPHDVDELEALRHEAGAADLELARAALHLVESRGAHPGRPLVADLERLVLARTAPDRSAPS